MNKLSAALKKVIAKAKQASTLPEGYIVAHDGPNRAFRRRAAQEIARRQRRAFRRAARLKKLGMLWMMEVA